MKLELRNEFGREIISICCYMDTGIDTPPGEVLVDNEVNIEEQDWLWNSKVYNMIRHEEVIGMWLTDHGRTKCKCDSDTVGLNTSSVGTKELTRCAQVKTNEFLWCQENSD